MLNLKLAPHRSILLTNNSTRRVRVDLQLPACVEVCREDAKCKIRKDNDVETPVSNIAGLGTASDRLPDLYPLGNQPAIADVAEAHREAYRFDPLPSHLDEAIRHLEQCLRDAYGMEGEPNYSAGYNAYRLGGVTAGVKLALAELRRMK